MLPRFEEAKILIVDDEVANVRLLERILKRADYPNVLATTEPLRALEIYREQPPDLVLLDLRMPRLDGFELLEKMTADLEEGDFLPIVVLTADPSLEARERALSAGATDFLTKPFHASEVLLRIRNLLHTRRMHLDLRIENRHLGARVLEQTRALERAQADVLERLAQAVEARDGETGEHTRRVGENAARLGSELSLPQDTIVLLRRAAPLHDVGKIGIPDAILLKPGRLTPDEFEIVKTHTTIGARMLSGGRSDLIRLAEEIARWHHEKWDGSGYPEGLAGEAIPLSARIVAVADFFDALCHDRPYRPAWKVCDVLAEVRALAGTHFDPAVVEALLKTHELGRIII